MRKSCSRAVAVTIYGPLPAGIPGAAAAGHFDRPCEGRSESRIGIAPMPVRDIARSIVAINRDDGVSVILVEQNSHLAPRISDRAHALGTGRIAPAGRSSEPLNDERIKRAYLGV